MICVPIVGPTQAQALIDIAEARSLADFLELRLDLIADFDLQVLLKNAESKVIVTYRPAREGGQCTLSDEERVKILLDALRLGATYIDVEWDAFHLIPPSSQESVIISRHFFHEFPENLEEIIESLSQLNAKITKLAVKVSELAQNARLFHALKNKKKPLILLGMGEEGLISRICSRVFGGFLTFASLSKGKESAAGQISVEELLHRFRFRSHNQDTKLYGVVANPVTHSLSPDIHNAGFGELGFNGLYVPLKVNNYQLFMQELAPFFSGFSITIPHKENLFRYAKAPSDLLKQIGALNTLTAIGHGEWEGKNTDILAAIAALEEVIVDRSLKDKTVLVLGAGGASRAIVIGLLKAGAKVTITNRTASKGKTLANEINVPFISLEDIHLMEALPYQVIINTTSVGMMPNVEESPLPGVRFHKGQVIFDAIYNPAKTQLILHALKDGATCLTGREMFVKQGALQFERWVQKPAPIELFHKILDKKLG